MGMSNYECKICDGCRCARYEGTNPMYANDDEGGCDENCGGGQSCAEQTSVMVPEHLLYASRDAPLPVVLPAFIPSVFDGYEHHPEIALDAGDAPVMNHLTSGMLTVPAHSFHFPRPCNLDGDGSPLSTKEGEEMLEYENEKQSSGVGNMGPMMNEMLFLNMMMMGNIAGAMAAAQMAQSGGPPG